MEISLKNFFVGLKIPFDVKKIKFMIMLPEVFCMHCKDLKFKIFEV